MKGKMRLLNLLVSLVTVITLLVPMAPVRAAIPTEDAPSPDPPPTLGEEQGGWAALQEAEPIDPGPWDQRSPRAAADSAGNLYVVWMDYRDDDIPHIRFAYRPAGGTWQASEPISPTHPANTSGQHSPDIAVDGSSNAYAVWQDKDVGTGKRQIYFSYRPAGGTWEAGRPISTTAQDQSSPAIAVNHRGDVAVAWLQGKWGTRHLFVAFRPAGGDWGPAERLSETPGIILVPDVAIDNWGRVYVIWEQDEKVLFSLRQPDGSWGPIEQVRDTETGSGWVPKIAVDGEGNAHAVWEDHRNDAGDIYAAYRPAGGTWSVNVRVNDDDTDQEQWLPDVSVDGAGNAIATWIDFRQNPADIFVAVRYLGGGWGPNELLVPSPASAAGARAPSPQAPTGYYPQGHPNSASGSGEETNIVYSRQTSDEDHNIYNWRGPGPGANGRCSPPMIALRSSASRTGLAALALAQGGAPGRCRVGGGQAPPNNEDDSDFSLLPLPPWAPPVMGILVDGRVLYVVKVPGHFGMFDNRADAERFAVRVGTPPQPFQAPAKPTPQPTPRPTPPPTPKRQAKVPTPTPPPTRRETTAEMEERKAAKYRWMYRELWKAVKDYERYGPELFGTRNMAKMWKWVIKFKQRNYGRWRALEWRLRQAQKYWRTGGRAPRGYEWKYDYGWVLKKVRPSRRRTPPPKRTPPPSVSRARIKAAKRKQFDRILKQWQKNEEKYKGTGGFFKYYRTVGELARCSDPVLPHSGEFVHEQTLLRIPGRGLDYEFRLTYHSQLIYDGPVGWGWEHNYDRRVIPTGGGSLARQEGAGRVDVYSFDGTDYTPPAGRYTAVISTTAGITITDRYGNVEGYYPLDGSPVAGRLRSIADRNGNALRFAYDGQGRLVTVTDTLGREITYAYDDHDRIIAVTDFAGRTVTLTYDDNGDLVSVTTPAVTGTPNGNDFPDGKTTLFSYTSGFEDERLNHNLTAIINPNEVADGSLIPRTINTYGTEGPAFDRVIHQSWGGGRSNSSGIPAGGEVTVVYTTTIEADAPPGAASKTTITDRGGNVIELWHDGAGHRLRDRQVVDGQVLITDYTYNADGLVTSITYPAGNRVEYTYDDGAADRFAQGNLLEVRHVADPARGCDGVGSPCPDLVTTYTYEPNFQMLQSLTDPNGNTTTYTYDDHGNLVRVDFPEVTVGPSAPQTAFETWTYNQWGQPLTFTDPEGNVTCYEYYATGPAAGYLRRAIQDCGGQDLTTEYEYDAVGNVTAVTDPRGIRTEYTYNALNQVVKMTRDPAPTASGASPLTATALDYETLYWYDANDNLVRVDVENVLPDLDDDFHPTGTYSRDPSNPWFTTLYAYDLLDNMVTQTVEISPTAQAVIGYRYDPLERLVSVTYPRGNRVEYTYDGRSLLRQVIRGAGSAEASTTTYEYDANGNVVRVTDGEGHPTDYVYDGFDRQVGSVDALGNIRLWRYDANGNPIEEITRDGQEGRNPGRTITATTAVTLSHELSYFDERNRCYREEREFFIADVDTGAITPLNTDGDGDGWVETTYAYDRNGNITAVTEDNGQTTTYVYDGLDRLVLRTDALGNTVAYTYDGNSNLVQTVATERQPDGLAPDEVFTTTYVYDAADRLVETTDSLGQTTRRAYDSRGNLVFTSDANGPVSGGVNDHGNTALFAYDGMDRQVRETYHLRAGGTGAGAVVGQVTLTYDYDANGNLVRFTDPNGNVTTYAYDALDRLVEVTQPDGTTATYAYDRAYNLVQQTDPNGTVMDYTYDGLNRQVRADVTPGPGVGGTTLQTFTWDGLSRQVAATDNNDPADPTDDSVVEFAYDSLSNRIEETRNGHTVTSTYDGMGNMLTLTYPGGTNLTYTYDALNRVKTIADGGGFIATYDYIGPWRVLRRTDGNGTYVEYAYDGAGRVTEIAYRRGGDDSLLSGFGYTYDRVGNRLTESDLMDGGTVTYAYDSLYRLVGAEGPDFDLQYVYDAAGNRVQVVQDGEVISYTVNEMNEYESVGEESRTYDANGNLLSRRMVQRCAALTGVSIVGPTEGYTDTTYTFTAAVIPPDATEPIAYTWSPEPQSGQGTAQAAYTWAAPGVYTITLTAGNCGGTVTATHTITIAAGPAGWYIYLPLIVRGTGGLGTGHPAPPVHATATTITETLTRYEYDFADRLLGVTKVVTVTTDGDVQVTTEAARFTYDALDCPVSRQAGNGTVRYLYAGEWTIEERDEADGILATYVEDLVMERGGSRFFYQADGPGSVRALADGAGSVVERVDYEPFGRPIFEGGAGSSGLDNPYLFRDLRYDAESGLYVYDGRRYEPGTGRYLQRGERSLGNPYTFAGNNPLGGVIR